MRNRLTIILMLCALWLAAAPTGLPRCAAAPAPAGFALHDGDTVVFYGDSITEQQMYGRDIETFVDTRLPHLHVKFINSGWSGDKVTGGGGGPIDLRLTRDVVNYKPTVVTIFLGMNDGGYKPYDQATFQTYAAGLTHIVDTLTQALPHARLTLLTPSYFDYAAKQRPALPATPGGYNYGNPAPDYNQTLVRYGDFVKTLGAQRHLTVVDLNAPMAAATLAGRRTDPKFALSGDGVHPNEVGHLIMAAAVLTAWHAPLMPVITLSSGAATKAKVWPLPWPLPASAQAGLPGAPQAIMPEAARLEEWPASLPGINKNAQQPYGLLADSQAIAALTAGQIAGGIDLAQYPILAQNVQAQGVLALVQQRTDAWHEFWKGKSGLVHANDIPTEDELAQLRAENAALDTLRGQAHAAAQPQAHSFRVQAAGPAHPQATQGAQTR